MVFGKDNVQECQKSLQGSSEAIFHHAYAVQHLAEALEDEVSTSARELVARITLLYDSAARLSHAGLEIARAGTRIADCCDHLALTMQQGVRVAAAGMLTVAAGQYGWQYLLLGCLLLRLAGFQILWSNQSGPIGARSSSKDAAWQSADPEGRASPEKNGNGMSAMEQHIYRLLGGSSGGGAAAAAPEAPVGNGLLDRTGDGGFPDLQRGSQPGIPQEPQPPLSSRGASGGSAQPQSPQFPQASLDGVFVRRRAGLAASSGTGATTGAIADAPANGVTEAAEALADRIRSGLK